MQDLATAQRTMAREADSVAETTKAMVAPTMAMEVSPLGTMEAILGDLVEMAADFQADQEVDQEADQEADQAAVGAAFLTPEVQDHMLDLVKGQAVQVEAAVHLHQVVVQSAPAPITIRGWGALIIGPSTERFQRI